MPAITPFTSLPDYFSQQHVIVQVNIDHVSSSGNIFEAQAEPGERMSFNTEFADDDYARSLGLKIIAGRDFSTQFPTDSTDAVLINHTAATMLGYTELPQAVGKWIRNISADSLPRTIVGVVEDFHFASLRQPIGPLVISTKKDDRRLALIELSAGDQKQTLDRIRKIYTGLIPAYPFEYSFLDENFDKLYKAENKQEPLLGVFSLIAIVIARLGLFGLTSYTTWER